eukprot:6491970-Amphidinium_carterae.1
MQVNLFFKGLVMGLFMLFSCAVIWGGQTTVFCCSALKTNSQEQGLSALSHWKQKIDLNRVMENAIDKRSINGLRQAELRCKDQETKDLLHNFVRLVEACQQLNPEKFPQTTDGELKRVLDVLEDNDVAIPPSVRHSLILRRTTRLMAEKKYAELVDCVNPFKVEAFSTKEPSIAGLEAADGDRRIGTFKRIVFNEVLSKMLRKGAEEEEAVKAFCMICIKAFEKTDLLEADAATAACHTSAMHIWRGLKALLVPCMDVSLQDLLFNVL